MIIILHLVADPNGNKYLLFWAIRGYAFFVPDDRVLSHYITKRFSLILKLGLDLEMAFNFGKISA